MKSRYVNWNEINERREWEFTGADLLIKKAYTSNLEPKAIEESILDIAERHRPIYNKVYPIESLNLSESKIEKVCRETDCTIILNKNENRYYLGLCGAGLDMSQDIAMAYIISDGRIEWDMLDEINISGPFSVTNTQYQTILSHMKRQLQANISKKQYILNSVSAQIIP